ncbi:hypothetical protein GC163_09265 [bacterium]|nr:hypothetical protein [bacterium]
MSVFFVIYTLSIGPCFWYWFEATYVDGSKWWVVFYFPLVLLCDLIPPLGELVNWYIRLWIL